MNIWLVEVEIIKDHEVWSKYLCYWFAPVLTAAEDCLPPQFPSLIFIRFSSRSCVADEYINNLDLHIHFWWYICAVYCPHMNMSGAFLGCNKRQRKQLHEFLFQENTGTQASSLVIWKMQLLWPHCGLSIETFIYFLLVTVVRFWLWSAWTGNKSKRNIRRRPSIQMSF